MKKFYTIIGQQELSKSFYGNEKRALFTQCKEKVYFPITTYISKTIAEDEKFEVVVVDSFNSVASKKNVELLKAELYDKFNDHFVYTVITEDFSYAQKDQIKTFMNLYETFKEYDEVYFDMTFGLKPIPMTVFVSCNYALKFVKGLKIRNIIYAHYTFGADEDFIHPIADVTSLFLLNNLIDTLSNMNSKDPMTFIKEVFSVE